MNVILTVLNFAASLLIFLNFTVSLLTAMNCCCWCVYIMVVCVVDMNVT